MQQLNKYKIVFSRRRRRRCRFWKNCAKNKIKQINIIYNNIVWYIVHNSCILTCTAAAVVASVVAFQFSFWLFLVDGNRPINKVGSQTTLSRIRYKRKLCNKSAQSANNNHYNNNNNKLSISYSIGHFFDWPSSRLTFWTHAIFGAATNCQGNCELNEIMKLFIFNRFPD